MTGFVEAAGPVRHAIGLTWTKGYTEGGSSGAPLFRNGQYVVGVLSSGTVGCTDRNHSNVGSFGGFYPRIAKWLRPGVWAGSAHLALESMQASAGRVASGASLELSVSMRNVGNSIASKGRMQFHRSLDDRVDAQDARVGPALDFPALPPAAAHHFPPLMVDPVAGEGVRYYGACLIASDGGAVPQCSPSVRVAVDAPL